MASMKDIKRRKSSIQSTQQITKAMKLVSTVKLQKAKSRAEQTDPYFNYMYRTVSSMLARSGNINHPYLRAGESTKKAVVVITSNRGLAGGYNSNIVKLITGSDLPKEDLEIYAIGNKGREALERRGYHIKLDDSEIMESPTYEDAAALCKQILTSFTNGEIGEIYLAYTHFKNTVSHEPKLIKLLPIELSDEEIADILPVAESLNSWVQDLMAYATQEAVDGKHWPGYKLVAGRTVRKYTSEAEVIKAATEAGYTDIYKTTLLGVGDLEKRLGRKKFSEVLGRYVVKPQGAPTLVPETDPRKPYSDAAGDFKE